MRDGILGIDCCTPKIAVVLIDPERQELLDARSAETYAEVPGDLASRREQDVSLLEEIQQLAGGEVPLASGYGIVTLYHWLRYENPPGLASVCNIADLPCRRGGASGFDSQRH